MIDELIQDFFKKVVQLRNLNWRQFKIDGQDLNYYSDEELAVISDYYEYYYAEDELYVIRDIRLNSIYFKYARSPKEALKSFFVNKDKWGMRE